MRLDGRDHARPCRSFPLCTNAPQLTGPSSYPNQLLPDKGGGSGAVNAVEAPPGLWGCLLLCVLSGGVLLSHVGYHAVPSALRGLASGFGMGPGVSRLAMAAVTLWRYARYYQAGSPWVGSC